MTGPRRSRAPGPRPRLVLPLAGGPARRPARPVRHEHASRGPRLVPAVDRPARGAARERLPRRLVPAAQAGDCPLRGRRREPGRGRGRLRRGDPARGGARARPGTGRAGAPADVPAVHGRGAESRRRRRRHPAAGRASSPTGTRSSRQRHARTSRSSARRTTPPATMPSAGLVRAVCAACPGIVLCDQAYVELGGRRPPAARRRARQPDRRAHVLEGVRRSAPRASATASRSPRWRPRSTRCALRARSRPGRPRSARSRADRRRRCASASPAPWPSAIASPRAIRAGRRAIVAAVAGNFVLGRLPDARCLRAPRRAGSGGADVRARAAPGRLLPGDGIESRRERPAAAQRSPSSREARYGRPSEPSGGRRGEVRRATKETRIDCALALDGPDEHAWRPASASSTTC